MNGDDEDDEADKTPPRTPSAQQRLGLIVCPRCKGNGNDIEHTTPCILCHGGKRVAVDKAIEYNLKQKH